MSPFSVGAIAGIAWMIAGLRILMLLDELSTSPVCRWLADREIIAWAALVAWPITVAIDSAIAWRQGRIQ